MSLKLWSGHSAHLESPGASWEEGAAPAAPAPCTQLSFRKSLLFRPLRLPSGLSALELLASWTPCSLLSWCHVCLRTRLVYFTSGWQLGGERILGWNHFPLKFGRQCSADFYFPILLLKNSVFLISVSLQITYSSSPWKPEGSFLSPWCSETSQRCALLCVSSCPLCLGTW